MGVGIVGVGRSCGCWELCAGWQNIPGHVMTRAGLSRRVGIEKYIPREKIKKLCYFVQTLAYLQQRKVFFSCRMDRDASFPKSDFRLRCSF